MEVARDTGFVKRNRKLQPTHFLDSLMFNVHDNKLSSLNDHAVNIQLKHNTAIKKQSLDERFSSDSVTFVKTLLEEQLKTQVSATLTGICLDQFSSVRIKDSTRFQLPESLKEEYPGSGGAASEAGVHIQFEFDVKSGKVSALKATDAKSQDVTDAAETVSDIERGSLIIRDLGYFSPKVLQAIANKRKAYFITRLMPGLKVTRRTNGRFELLDLVKERNIMKRSGIKCKELQVYLGNDQENPVRLMMELIPEKEVEQRMRKASQKAHKKGRTLKKGYKAYASLGLFITNIPEEWMQPEQLRTVYRLRWQIELRFKCWKGLCKIHAIKKMKLHRFETCLYARLLFILVHWQISMSLVAECWKRKKEMLSIYKCYKTLLQCANMLRDALFQSLNKLRQYFKMLDRINHQNLLLEKRKGRESFTEILLQKER